MCEQRVTLFVTSLIEYCERYARRETVDNASSDDISDGDDISDDDSCACEDDIAGNADL